MRNFRKWVAPICMCSFLLTGCANENIFTLEKIPRDIYQKNSYETVEICKGDVKPTLKLKLKPRVAEQINYVVDFSNLEVESINVAVGDSVKKGQVLITFKSDEIRKNILKYEEELKKEELLLEHLRKISVIDTQPKNYTGMSEKDTLKLYRQKAEGEAQKQAEYRVEIAKLEEDAALAATYLEEERQRLADCRVVAQNDGTITFVSKYLLSGFVEPGVNLVSEVCGRNLYEAVTTDDFPLKIGDIYQCADEQTTYDMMVVDDETDSSGKRSIWFEPSGIAINPSESKTLEMVIPKPVLKDVWYVDSKAVYEKEGRNYMFEIDENGFLIPIFVTCGEAVDGVTIIKDGIDNTKRVAVK